MNNWHKDSQLRLWTFAVLMFMSFAATNVEAQAALGSAYSNARCPDGTAPGPNLFENPTFNRGRDGGWSHEGYRWSMETPYPLDDTIRSLRGRFGMGHQIINQDTFPGDRAHDVAPTQWWAAANGNRTGSPQTPFLKTFSGLKRNTTYIFSGYLSNAINPLQKESYTADPTLTVFDGSTMIDSFVVRGESTDVWKRFAYAIRSRTRSSVALSLRNSQSGYLGNDLAMTHFYFVECVPDGCSSNAECSGLTPFCDARSGECVACTSNGHCNDGNECTRDRCLSNICRSNDHPSGRSCDDGACDGNGLCVECVDDGDCGGASPFCKTATNECVACLSNGQCEDGNLCTLDRCVSNECRSSDRPRNFMCGVGLVCDGAGTCQGCNQDSQCDDGNECTSNRCAAGVCQHTNMPEGRQCDGGDVCDGNGMCEECIQDTHCDGDERCSAARRCVECLSAAECDDGNACTADFCSADGTCGYDDLQAGTACGALARCNGNGECEERDSDGDGVVDRIDADDDNDGITDVAELGRDLSLDIDRNGIADYEDSDVVSCADMNADGRCDLLPKEVDFDQDGIPNHLDLDSDGDGIFDLIESRTDTLFDADGRLDTEVDEDGDGLLATADANDRNASVNTSGYTPSDRDGKGGADFLDLDADDDGYEDSLECITAPCRDSDGDRVADYQDADDDDDSILSKKEREESATFGNPDRDSVQASLDLDSDGDGIGDASEAGWDLDLDGIPDYLDPNSGPNDSDGDGIPDLVECERRMPCEDTDDDGSPDYLDLDSDNDGIGDRLECPHPQACRDTEADGLVDYRDIDSDADGIVDGAECISISCDADSDGVPNYIDQNSDNDDWPDSVEGHDENFDRIADRIPSGMDSDMDGLDDAFDTDAGGVGAPLPDYDEDGVPDFVDSNDAREQLPETSPDAGVQATLGGPAGGGSCSASDDDEQSFSWIFLIGLCIGLLRFRARK